MYVIIFFVFVLDYGCDENNARKKRSAEDDLGKKITLDV